MKFHIFRWWEIWAKPVLYTFVLLLTGGLFALYFNVNDKDGYFAFVISIIYALFLFLITIPINRIDAYTADKLYEREGYYLALKRLREVTNSTIQKINVNDVKDFAIKIGSFQIFTGRDEESCQRRVAGERVPIYAKEKGFEYTAKMLRLETEFLKISSIENEKKILRKGKALKKYSTKNCKKLEKNYSKISSVLTHLYLVLLPPTQKWQ